MEIEALSITLGSRRAQRPLLDGVSLRVDSGETVGLVGESGSGKSVTSRAALGMLPAGAAASGRIVVNGRDVLGARRAALADLRRHDATMIFQDPRAAINPLRRIRDFLSETGPARGGADAERQQLELLASVGISDPAEVRRRYPHQLSGGMLQRVMIAAALAPEPVLLLADEPTTALDVTIQAEVVAVLKSRQTRAGAGMLFVTHDLDLAAAICDRIYVMYAGQIVEEQPALSLFAAPQHPYSRALLAASPRLEGGGPIQAIPGRPPSLAESFRGCPFAPRCPVSEDACQSWPPRRLPAGAGSAACLHFDSEHGESR